MYFLPFLILCIVFFKKYYSILLTFAVHPSIHIPHWRDIPHLKAATWFLYCWDFSYSEAAITSIHPHTLLMGFSPLWGGYKIPPLLDFFHSEDYMCTLRWWNFPFRGVNTACLQALSRPSYGSRNLHCGIFPTRSPHSAAGIFFLLELPFDVPPMSFFPPGVQTLAHQLSRLNLWEDEPPIIFLYWGPSIHISIWGIRPCSRASIYIPMMGLPSLERQLRCGDFPTRRSTLLLWRPVISAPTVTTRRVFM